jgi:hypothetical protein
MIRPLLSLVFVLFVLTSTGCERRDSAVVAQGKIQIRMVTAIEARRPSEVIIESRGGDRAPAIALAQYIQSHRVAVTVRGLCASACAQYVWIASSRRRVVPGSVIVFHNSAVAMKALLSGDPDRSVSHFYDDQAQAELTLYHERGIDTRLLLWPLYRMVPVCYAVQRSGENVSDVLFVAQKAGWTTSSSSLRRAGVAFQGQLPDDAFALDTALAREAREFSGRVAFDDRPLDLSFEELVRMLQSRVTRCPASPEQ